MPKKISDEERIIKYFEEAPIAKVEVVLSIVSAKVKQRKKVEAKEVALLGEPLNTLSLYDDLQRLTKPFTKQEGVPA